MADGKDYTRCLDKLIWATRQLGGTADNDRLAKTANLIIQAMTGPWRYFHTPNHIFEVGEGGDAIEILAALFHDLVYVQVDQGVSVNIGRFIAPFIHEENGQLVINDRQDLPADRMFEMVLQIFNFSPSQPLQPTAGQNEFLSAVICAKCLETSLAEKVIAAIAACIEMTIPFRPKFADGTSVGDALLVRMRQVNKGFYLGYTDADLEALVLRSVRLANRDVENFANPNASHFLNNTWNLLPETNHDLKYVNSYTVHGYRRSLQKMEGFLSFLEPERVFQQFAGYPDAQTYQGLIDRTRRNIEVGKLYLGSKLTSITVLEALSLRIGHNTPISTMMGELPTPENPDNYSLEQFLPYVHNSHEPETDLELEVLTLLEKGRTLDSSYDIRHSPVATFMVKRLGFREIRRLILKCKDFFAENASAEEFLGDCDPFIVESVSAGVLQLFETRKASLQGLSPSQVISA
ncbi:hypothetical protein Pse7367_1602 [Thalassoporum mexicanum PCC 7367]|uniref:hypothetical protein n=1 Tax=Thalassoporum mexicanum TaxID=3457544 RepID=UPI00029F85EC|nr:hypothetical protein [Pseudanabaena sp. PCC 7367]AFY69891.1 hypothetical protein Pse7367_1602 [Pseudanabaena sp. PCC 7367]